MESKLTSEQHQLLRGVLVAQTESLGRVEIPVVEDLLTRHQCRRVLDVGCGEGSFLLNLAHRMRRVRFVGMDHSELAIRDAALRLEGEASADVEFHAAFFDSSYDPSTYDAILTRYTLQHSSDPRGFLRAVADRLEPNGVFVCMESLDAYTDCHELDPVWERFRDSIRAIHERVGSNPNIGKSLGRLLADAGLADVQVRIVLCSPTTVGWDRFRAVVQASAELAFSFFPELFDRTLLENLREWLDDRAALERKDPYLCSAIANGTRPS
jgi:SAM-dependent methyltransferase